MEKNLFSRLMDFTSWLGLINLSYFTTSKDKRRYAYILTPKGIAPKIAITRFLARKIAEYDASRAEIDALRD